METQSLKGGVGLGLLHSIMLQGSPDLVDLAFKLYLE